MKVRYVGGHDEVEIGDTGVTCKRGAAVEVDGDLGKSLLEQPDNWEAVKATTKKEARDGAA